MRHLDRFTRAIDARHHAGLLRAIPTQDATGIDFAGNDYLGLSRHPEVVAAACEAMHRFGTGARASRLVNGGTTVHAELEAELAAFKSCESAILFPSGFQGAAGFIAEAAAEGDTILLDRLAHACLVAGASIARAHLRVFRHNDIAQLDHLLERAPATGVRWVVVDGVYSMDGDLAPLPELMELCERHDAVLVVDEAHATGTIGPKGRGTFEHCGISPVRMPHRVVVVATLGKALGSQGGAILGPAVLREWCANFVRAQVYSTALAPAAAAAALAALRIIAKEPTRVASLQAKAELIRSELRTHGLAVAESPAPIIPVILGEGVAVMELATYLRHAGFACAAIRPPTVPRDTSRLRISISDARTEQEIRRLAGAVGSWMFESRCRR